MRASRAPRSHRATNPSLNPLPTSISPSLPPRADGSEWLYAGGNDPGCREPLWNPGISYNATAAPLGSFLARTNEYRRTARVWESLQVERWQDDRWVELVCGTCSVGPD